VSTSRHFRRRRDDTARKTRVVAILIPEEHMAGKNHSSVSVSGALYRRLLSECGAQRILVGPTVKSVISDSLDRFESDADARTAFIAEVKSQRPDRGPGSIDFSVKGPTAARLATLRRRTGRTNNELVAAMLDRAGAP
jgi:hypothetical protein